MAKKTDTRPARFMLTGRGVPVPGFPERLSEFIESAGGLTEVSTNLGISFSVLYNWSTGRRFPSIAALVVLAAYFETTPDKLLCVEPTPTKEAKRLGVKDDLALWRRRKVELGRERARIEKEERRAAREQASVVE